MEKTPRYTQRERNMVLGFAAQYKDVIENKRTDAESNRKKDDVWRTIAKEFNSRAYHQRSSKQLRQLYKNMKLLLKKDLCGDGRDGTPNRSFMDILAALSQQDSVGQYISNLDLSPTGYSSSRNQLKLNDDLDADAKLAHAAYNAMDNDVIVIKSEDISDNEQSSQNGGGMDGDDDDCLSSKDIPEVCLEEEDSAIFTGGARQPADLMIQTIGIGSNTTSSSCGDSRGNDTANGIVTNNGVNVRVNGNRYAPNHPTNTLRNQQNNLSNQRIHSFNMNSNMNNNSTPINHNHQHQLNHFNHLNISGQDPMSHLLSNSSNSLLSNGSSPSNENNRSEYLLTLAIEERKRKIDLLNAQIDYWKTLTKKLETNIGHNPSPSCLCHFPKMNGMQHQS